MSNTQPFKSVTEYFDAQPIKTKDALIELKESILSVVPNAIEMLNYNIPAYELIEGGKRNAQLMIGANTNSVSFYPHPTTMEKFDLELTKFKRGKGSVQFPLDKPLPKELIIEMVTYRYSLLLKSTSN